ncbi:hypothetical protein [Halomonas ramblicola]|uniref:hypothetical protein n=1 Tax=Halomonas ramblicola TaxID=747349 RepID=UPI0025B4B99A|nr:hypothetical protein [Halomonas ramblicola]MDN3522553.1 hypothetical protein [Halomonas ramblicola]
MRLEAIIARPNPHGYGVDLAWGYPPAPDYPAVRVVRRSGTHPLDPDDGVVVAEGEGLTAARDTGLEAEVTYYYTLFPYRGTPRDYVVDRRNRVAAMATGVYQLAEQMYEALPALYRRYDIALPDPTRVAAEDAERGQLRRLLELPGAQLDQLYSVIRALPRLYEVPQAPGSVLPLLAQWIGWQTDTRRELDSQRNELAYAPALYQRLGILPTVSATTKRVTGWESRTKEFVHNVHRSNQPERLNLWARRRDTTGEEPDGWPAQGEPLSLDHAFDGRPALAREGDVLWLFYHTPRNGRWDLWYKTLAIGADGTWTPSRRLTHRAVLDKHPTATVAGGVLWLFWSGFDEADGRWRLYRQRREAGEWLAEPELAGVTGVGSQEPAATRADGAVWLFWLQREAGSSRLRYARHAGGGWSADVDFPDDDGALPRVEAEPFAAFQGAPGSPRLFVFWARKRPGGGAGQTRWQIAYRVKTSLAADASGWSNVRTLPVDPPEADFHDRQPFAHVDDGGELTLYWSSNRGTTGYCLWRSRLSAFDSDLAAGTDTWSEPRRLTDGPYAERYPAVIDAGTERWLLYRSNRHLSHRSQVYRATTLIDGRYAGSLAVDPRNGAQLALHRAYEDFLTFTFDTGDGGRRDDRHWYGRDTVGIYLDNDTLDEAVVARGIDRLGRVLREFMPLTERAVFMPRHDLHTEWVYHYHRPAAGDHHTITETLIDELNGERQESLFGPGEDFSDQLE